jgi:hypothetical protein
MKAAIIVGCALLLATGTTHAREPDWTCDNPNGTIRIYHEKNGVSIRWPPGHEISGTITLHLQRLQIAPRGRDKRTVTTVLEADGDGDGCKQTR